MSKQILITASLGLLFLSGSLYAEVLYQPIPIAHVNDPELKLEQLQQVLHRVQSDGIQAPNAPKEIQLHLNIQEPPMMLRQSIFLSRLNSGRDNYLFHVLHHTDPDYHTNWIKAVIKLDLSDRPGFFPHPAVEKAAILEISAGESTLKNIGPIFGKDLFRHIRGVKHAILRSYKFLFPGMI